jgi:hypothetical protein
MTKLFPPWAALVVSVPVLLLGLGSCDLFSSGPSPPDVAWDPSPEALVVRATLCCGFVPAIIPLNYIPDGQIWGDGSVLWVERSETGARQVLEGRLATEALRALLQRSVDEGFFGWQDRYAVDTIADLPDQCLFVALLDRQKQVCEHYRGAPQAFHELYDEVARGVGAVGSPYRPTRGYLTAHPITPRAPSTPVDLIWPTSAVGFSLQEAEDGRWIEGEALTLSWEVINANTWGHLVRDGSEYYQLSLQIPGVSFLPPPEPGM